MNKDPFSKALSYAYRLLAIRERTEKEIKTRLNEKGYEKGCIEEVVQYLKDKKLLDDDRFAKEWIKKRSIFSPKGAFAIRDELLKKGIEENIIDSAFKDEKVGYNEYAVCKALADKRIGSLKKLKKIEQKKSIYGYLARRGFSFDVINDIIDDL